MLSNFTQYRPCAVLRPFVRRFLVIEATAAHQDLHLPEIGFVAAFRFRGNCLLAGDTSAPSLAVTGLWNRQRTHVHTQDYGAIIATFTATGGAALLRIPADELANTTTDLAPFLDVTTRLTQFQAQLMAATTPEARIQQVSTLLLTQLAEHRPDPEVSHAVALIERSPALVRIEQLAQQVGLSQSALERRFRRHVGIAPRKYASLVRLHHVVRLQATGADFTTIAHAAGYADQAHFNKDFKRFAGFAPSVFFARSHENR